MVNSEDSGKLVQKKSRIGNLHIPILDFLILVFSYRKFAKTIKSIIWKNLVPNFSPTKREK